MLERLAMTPETCVVHMSLAALLLSCVLGVSYCSIALLCQPPVTHTVFWQKKALLSGRRKHCCLERGKVAEANPSIWSICSARHGANPALQKHFLWHVHRHFLSFSHGVYGAADGEPAQKKKVVYGKKKPQAKPRAAQELEAQPSGAASEAAEMQGAAQAQAAAESIDAAQAQGEEAKADAQQTEGGLKAEQAEVRFWSHTRVTSVLI